MQVEGALCDARDPWWVVGSAAVRLHGVATPVADVDVLLSERDAAALLPVLGLRPAAGEPDGRFRSAVFARWTAPPLVVEWMAGTCLREAGGWVPVTVTSRVFVAGIPIPDRAELAAILRRFGRAKDRERAALLEAMP